MAKLDEQFVRRCAGWQRAAARYAGSRFLGRRPVHALAGGTEVTGYSDYTTGDDFRYVDWNQAARHDELVSKQFHGTTRAPLYLLVDTGISMQLRGDADRSKFDYARMLAGAVGYLALANHDFVRVAGFDGKLGPISPAVEGTRTKS